MEHRAALGKQSISPAAVAPEVLLVLYALLHLGLGSNLLAKALLPTDPPGEVVTCISEAAQKLSEKGQKETYQERASRRCSISCLLHLFICWAEGAPLYSLP